MAIGATTNRPRKPSSMNHSASKLLPLLLLFIGVLLLFFRFPSSSPHLPCTPLPSSSRLWFGDLRDVEFSWNSLPLSSDRRPPIILKIAVFSRKWPSSAAPGGMERHALTLHSALSRRGHQVHVFTSSTDLSLPPSSSASSPRLHLLVGAWRCDEAFALFEAEHALSPFDVVHTESVALYHRFARRVPNLAVTWHGISLEALHSGIYQDLLRSNGEPLSPATNRSLASAIYKVLDEIRFFNSYAHHVAISDATGEMLRDVYQIPRDRVHVILNGIDEEDFRPDPDLGSAFLNELGLPSDAELIMGIAGRLVKDKGHPILYKSFAAVSRRHPKVYLVVAGSGPWEQRYREMGKNVIVTGALPPAKLRAFYNSIDVFVNPTLRPQGLDLTLMEAMQCGTAVMATRFPSIKGSVVVREELGVMFAPNVAALTEAMEKVVAEGRGKMAERGKACREYASAMFTAKKMAMAYERLFLCIKNETYCRFPLGFD
ncbi:hypothetical protein HPP92_023686 [Vanilla planifolia]|uniref:Glycosyltransferase subfamily 4-like N-terminal domain-containing protein n=1 Tax=Vanilla planifolia TaxID=51239 RepID=A0A835PR89_VANPL|nr:hypothetical protein HPP92_024029 [Vanilla planifolia]KAG0455898.1 hypothetical protein HPP92_023686 [Vanilla planifolia]